VLFRALVIVLAQNTIAVDQSDCNILIESVIIGRNTMFFFNLLNSWLLHDTEFV